jgi:hypothetical protein
VHGVSGFFISGFFICFEFDRQWRLRVAGGFLPFPKIARPEKAGKADTDQRKKPKGKTCLPYPLAFTLPTFLPFALTAYPSPFGGNTGQIRGQQSKEKNFLLLTFP